MDDKNTTDRTDIPITMNSESNISTQLNTAEVENSVFNISTQLNTAEVENSVFNISTQLNTAEVENSKKIEVVVAQVILKLETDLIKSIEKPEQYPFEDKNTSEVEKANNDESTKLEDIDMVMDLSIHQNHSVLVTQDIPKIKTETIAIEEPKILQYEDKKTPKVEEVIYDKPIQLENTAMEVNESTRQDHSREPVSDELILKTESSVILQESLIEPSLDQIIPFHHETMNKGSQEVIPLTESGLNNVVNEDNEIDLDHQSVLNMNDSDLKDFVMRELSEFLTSQHVGSPLFDVKSLKSDEKEKVESLENTLSVSKIDPKVTMKSEHDIADEFSTLTTSTLNQTPQASGSVDYKIVKPTQLVSLAKQEDSAWCDVGVINGNSCMVKQFYSTSVTDEHESTKLNNLPDYTNKLKIDLQPGTFYKFRVAAVNACGRGEWSDISAFKTCLPGYPDAPAAIRITKGPNGANLTWETPPTSAGNILEYCVCLAIKNPKKEETTKSSKPPGTNYNFVRVYCGPHNAAVVSYESLSAALIDRTNKPAIIFRIAAKNEKGYGPATQVRWLQESNVHGSSKNTSVKRENSVKLLTGVPKRPKI